MHCLMTDYWFDEMNSNSKKGWRLINSSEHQHVYDLLRFIKFHTEWRSQASDPCQYFPESTYEDLCWTSLGLVTLEVYFLPNHPGHNIIQRRHGSDVCEETFCLKRNANANADTKGTDNILSTKHGGVINKSNFGKRKTFFGSDEIRSHLVRHRCRYILRRANLHPHGANPDQLSLSRLSV